MAATDDQKLKVPVILGVPLESIEETLDGLSAAKLALLDEAIAAFWPLRFRAAKLNTDGVSVDPEEQRNLIRADVCAILEIANPYAGFVGTVMTEADYDATFGT